MAAWVDVLDLETATWTTLPRRPDAHGIISTNLFATPDGIVVGTKGPGVTSDAPVRADVFDGATWRRVGGTDLVARSHWHWTGARLVMPTPELDRDDESPGIALDVASDVWTELPEGPFVEDGGWWVDAAAGPHVAFAGLEYGDRTGDWSTVRVPSSALGDLGTARFLPGVWVGDQMLVVAHGTAWMSNS